MMNYSIVIKKNAVQAAGQYILPEEPQGQPVAAHIEYYLVRFGKPMMRPKRSTPWLPPEAVLPGRCSSPGGGAVMYNTITMGEGGVPGEC